MNIPKHVAIIMDGNGRWARNQGKDRSFGHKNGIKPLRECLKSSLNLGIKYLTIYSFSSENWNRPQDEIDALMDLLGRAIIEESDMLIENEVKIKIIGDLDKLPSETRESVESIMEVTKNFNRLTLVVGLSYSSRWEITEAVKLITKDTKEGKLKEEEINEELITFKLKIFLILIC
jgi:undecaprenyl diphosphate synthase